MEVLLTIYSDEKEYFSREVALPCVIGRGKQCDVTILHPLVSRRHCEIFEENGLVMTRDLGSLNGTFFGGSRIGRGVVVPNGASFSIGRLMLRVDDPAKVANEEKESISTPSATETPEEVDQVEIVDVDQLISDAPVQSQLESYPGGDSSVIDLDKYLNNG